MLLTLKNKDNIAKDIYSNTKTWKYIYYKNKFNVNIYINSYIINNASFNYIKGIFWTYSYYKNNIIDHTWYYPYNYPPTIKDISNYLYGNEMPIIEKMGEFITNELQLLIVIPKTSKNLLNDRLQKIMEDKKEAAIEAGKQAKLLLENPQMVAAFNTVLNGGYQQWISTDIKDTEIREALYHKQRAILEVKNTLVQTLDNGRILEEENKS